MTDQADGATMNTAWPDRWPRPLDPLRSIKMKLGVLVAASCGVTALIVKLGLDAGYSARYTLPVAVLVSLVVTQVLARGMTSPLREMTVAARAMARGDHGLRVRATSRDEVGELAEAFNSMVAELARSEGLRKEFIANVSHELRTPISALHAILENLADGVTTADPATLRTAADRTERLGRLIDQLLRLSRVDGGDQAIEPSGIDAAEFFETAIAHARAEHPGIDFSVDMPAGMTIVADRDRLHQVVSNLLDNAAVHGPSNGTVTIVLSAGTDPDRTVFEVTDEGPGIPPEDSEIVFHRFTRGSASRGTDGGTGLGLAIARWAVELHGGEIGVVDAPRGCRIRVTLPVAPVVEWEAD